MYTTPRVAGGLCRTLLLKSLENIPSGVGNGESKAQDILKTWKRCLLYLTLNLLTTTIVAPPSNASKWQMGFNSAFKGLNLALPVGISINF